MRGLRFELSLSSLESLRALVDFEKFDDFDVLGVLDKERGNERDTRGVPRGSQTEGEREREGGRETEREGAQHEMETRQRSRNTRGARERDASEPLAVSIIGCVQ